MSTEREAKFEVGADFRLPDLERAVGISVRPAGEVRLLATYYDTKGMDLARWGVTLRHRGVTRDSAKWTAKLPSKDDLDPQLLSRTEVDFPGGPELIPDEAVEFVGDFLRGRRLREVCELTTTRRRYNLVGKNGAAPFAELDDDTVEFETAGGATGTFREVEVELTPGSDGALLGEIGTALRAAGARAGNGEPKVLRALGWRTPPWPPQSLDADSTMEELISYALAGSLGRLLDNTPLVRTTELAEPVHQARVAARRLRSDLVTLQDEVKRKPQRRMRSGLRAVGLELGALRDADVMEQRLRDSVAKLSQRDQREAARFLERLDRERREHRSAVVKYLQSAKYLATVDLLAKAIDEPPIRSRSRRARRVLPSLVQGRWRKLSRRVEHLGSNPSDKQLHRVRIDAKRCRYAAELAAPVIGKEASRLGAGLADVQTVLGELHDAVVLASWLGDAQALLPGGPVGAGSTLIEMEHRRAESARREWVGTWRVIADQGLADWIA